MSLSIPLKEILSLIGVALSIYGLIPYYRGIFARTAKPHVFTWLIFALVTGIATAVQLSEDAGAGTWILATNAFLCLTITILALKFGEKDIRRSDWVALFAALAAIPVWIAMDDPLWAVLIIIIIELSAYLPTIRKSWNKPYEEVMQTWFIGVITFLISVIALDQINFTTAAYPLFIAFLNLSLVMILAGRRYVKAYQDDARK